MKKISKIGIITTVVLAFNFYIVTPVEAKASAYKIETTNSRADIIEWRYKTENGKMYKRKFNYSKNQWIGDWIFVANVS